MPMRTIECRGVIKAGDTNAAIEEPRLTSPRRSKFGNPLAKHPELVLEERRFRKEGLVLMGLELDAALAGRVRLVSLLYGTEFVVELRPEGIPAARLVADAPDRVTFEPTPIPEGASFSIGVAREPGVDGEIEVLAKLIVSDVTKAATTTTVAKPGAPPVRPGVPAPRPGMVRR